MPNQHAMEQMITHYFEHELDTDKNGCVDNNEMRAAFDAEDDNGIIKMLFQF